MGFAAGHTDCAAAVRTKAGAASAVAESARKRRRVVMDVSSGVRCFSR
jgi:hypothetical protein